jgi:hypothetical protein
MSQSETPTLAEGEWRRRKAAYEDAVRPWIDAHLARAARGIKHPVHDFLFEYYSYRPSHLARWSPGVGVRLNGARPADLAWRRGFVGCDGGLVLPAAAFPSHRVSYLRWAVRHLETVAGREPSFGCLGLHEWAMVYRTDDVRHAKVPLRLSADAIAAVVEGQGLRCTHYDAYRFFTPAASPRNRVALTRATTTDHDQPGCIHANMDMYKFAYAIAPFTSGESILETLTLAIEARRIDMRASPYELSAMSYESIAIETREGREQYIAEQRRIAEQAAPIRMRVLHEYRRLLDQIEQ